MPANPTITTPQVNALQDHAPAQMVGGMRVRTANRRRSSVAVEEKDQEEQEEEEDDDENRHQQNQQRQRAYQAARDAQLPRHPHANHQPRIDPSFQPRDLNH